MTHAIIRPKEAEYFIVHNVLKEVSYASETIRDLYCDCAADAGNCIRRECSGWVGHGRNQRRADIQSTRVLRPESKLRPGEHRIHQPRDERAGTRSIPVRGGQ